MFLNELSPVFLVNSRFIQLCAAYRAFLLPKLRNNFAEFLKYSYSKSLDTFMPDYSSQNETIYLKLSYKLNKICVLITTDFTKQCRYIICY
jgi:hypothetical protein